MIYFAAWVLTAAGFWWHGFWFAMRVAAHRFQVSEEERLASIRPPERDSTRRSVRLITVQFKR